PLTRRVPGHLFLTHFFFNDPAPTQIYTLSLHDALPISIPNACHESWLAMTPVENGRYCMSCRKNVMDFTNMSDREILKYISNAQDRKSTRLNSSHVKISYAVFCLKKKIREIRKIDRVD